MYDAILGRWTGAVKLPGNGETAVWAKGGGDGRFGSLAAKVGRPFPTGRKSDDEIVIFCPFRGDFRTNFLDNISSPCASLEGRREGVPERSEPRKGSLFTTMCMKTKPLRQDLRDFVEFVSA